jgi:hypothetical protein
MSDSTIVVKEASTWGTAVTPDRTFCLLGSGESLDYMPEIVTSGAHCWGKRGPSAAGEIVVRKMGGGDIPLEVSTAGFGFWWKMCMGSSVSAQIGATSVYQQVHKLAAASMPFMTVQKLVQSYNPVTGAFTTEPFTWGALMVASWTLNIPESGIATLTVTTTGRDVVTSTAAVVPAARSAADHLLHSGGASLSTGAYVAPGATTLATADTPVAGVRSLSITVDNNLVTLPGWGSAVSRPIPGAAPSVTGTLNVDYVTGGPFVSAFLNRTDLTLLATLAAVENADELVQIAIPALRVSGEIPKAGAPTEMQQLSVPFTAMRAVTSPDPELVVVVNRTYDTTI